MYVECTTNTYLLYKYATIRVFTDPYSSLCRQKYLSVKTKNYVPKAIQNKNKFLIKNISLKVHEKRSLSTILRRNAKISRLFGIFKRILSKYFCQKTLIRNFLKVEYTVGKRA